MRESERQHTDFEVSHDSDNESLEEAHRYNIANLRIDSYDPSSADEAHLKPHQAEAVTKFCVGVKSLARGEIEGGMAILHPTGGGKTVTTAALARILCERNENDTEHLKALMLVPGHQILGQTVGNDEELGALRMFAPRLSVGEYSGRIKNLGADVTVMNYQALPHAEVRGDVDKIDPDFIICDEAHHVIDGVWADVIARISKGRILLGLTATPGYSEHRDISRLFPNTLARKSMREGINEGILAPMQGYVYRGKSRIRITRKGADFAEEDLFEAIAYSDDNLLAAKICAQEVAQGRRGIVSCVPGFDRAHAKIMTEILAQTEIDTPEGRRKIRAAFVGGEIHPEELKRIFDDYHNNRIDVLAYVNLLLEGWDSPETDFTVLLRPTQSPLLVEQRLGRVIRPRDNKVATIHEVLYEVEGGTGQTQITHLDIMGTRNIKQGYHYGKAADNEANEKREPSEGRVFFADEHSLDPDIARRIAELEAVPLEEILIACGQEAIPVTWLTSHIIGQWYELNDEEVDSILNSAHVPSRTDHQGKIARTYYPRRAAKVIAKHLGIEELPSNYYTTADIVAHHRSFETTYGQRLSRIAIIRALADEGITPTLFVTEDGVKIPAYPPESLEVNPIFFTAGEEYTPKRSRHIETVQTDELNAKAAHEWLNRILVDPNSALTNGERRNILTAQNTLLTILNDATVISRAAIQALENQIEETSIEPTDQMKNVMAAKRVNFIQLLQAAKDAQDTIRKMEVNRIKASKSGGAKQGRLARRQFR